MNSFAAGLVLAIVGGALGQLLMKAGLNDLAQTAVFDMPAVLLSQPGNAVHLVMGVAAYFFSMLAWIHALKRYDLSFAYPLLSLGYVLVYVGAVLWPTLQETFTITKTAGVVLIVIGVSISAQAEFPPKSVEKGSAETGYA